MHPINTVYAIKYFAEIVQVYMYILLQYSCNASILDRCYSIIGVSLSVHIQVDNE